MFINTATGWVRLISRLIDTVTFIILFFIITLFYPGTFSPLTLTLVQIGLLIFLELIIPLSTKGQTIGKSIMQIRMVSTYKGTYASFEELADKCFIYSIIPITQLIPILKDVFIVIIIYFAVLTIFLIFTDSLNQGVIDKLCSILVVHDKLDLPLVTMNKKDFKKMKKNIKIEKREMKQANKYYKNLRKKKKPKKEKY